MSKVDYSDSIQTPIPEFRETVVQLPSQEFMEAVAWANVMRSRLHRKDTVLPPGLEYTQLPPCIEITQERIEGIFFANVIWAMERQMDIQCQK